MIAPKGLKAAIDPERFLRDRVQNPKPGSGWVQAGLCIAHDDQSAGSFYFNTETGASKCHSCGYHGGDIIDFAMQQDGTDFPTTIRNLAAEYGIADTEPTPEQRETISKRQQAQRDAKLDHAIHHECLILSQVTGNRITSSLLQRNHKFRAVRPDWGPFPTETWDREILAAERLMKILGVRYAANT